MPKFCITLKAISRPAPGPLTTTSACLKPYSKAFLAAYSVEICEAKGVPFLEPLKPQNPAEAEDITFPLLSVTETIVKNRN